ncbi:hypothetical protein SARC_04125 [Sphaeroforma arctica JP610]|uniref:Uncharacterized protein n=1 Tax=Sphaeroforma arctica JP610 TaxID=667725 RepID=A0A0L0G491_9EUKA|nr:hypothetical protein SARC_04125 [Sphaeroforma arctica JP610]KNC83626.1 hypothetical protein SARC_04125 [Sphaeroforma arctica JP610]|eukprot:XP_014157528.1 hypothetical protein SARC_04125 [Sphaeroforma arctica JP610]
MDLISKTLKENQSTKQEYTCPASPESFMSASYMTVQPAPKEVDTNKAAKDQRRFVVCGGEGPCGARGVRVRSTAPLRARGSTGKPGTKSSTGDTSLGVSADGNSIYIDAQEPEGAIAFGTASAISSLTSVVSKIKRDGKIPYNLHGDDKFVVKIQVPMTGPGTMMMYDEQRSFNRLVGMKEPGAMKLYKTIEAVGLGKLYFMAIREGTKFKFLLSPLPSQWQPW